MVKNGSKRTVPLVSQQANATQNASSRERWLSALQVVGGGAPVFVAALIFGNAWWCPLIVHRRASLERGHAPLPGRDYSPPVSRRYESRGV